MPSTYDAKLTLTASDGTATTLTGQLTAESDSKPTTCPVPGEDTTTAGPGQKLREGGPGKFDMHGCPTVAAVKTPYWPAPSQAERYIKVFDDAMPDATALWPLPKWRARPRLFLGDDGLTRLKARWTDPSYDSVVKQYRGKNDALSAALEYLATGNKGKVATAYNDAMAEPYALFYDGEHKRFSSDKGSFVLDWCYQDLSSDQRRQLTAKLADNIAKRKTKLEGSFSLHESERKGFPAWLLGAIAISGEDGTDSDLDRQIARAMQHYVGWQNQCVGDGFQATYIPQDRYWIMAPIVYGLASGQNMTERASFLRYRSDAVLRLLAPDGSKPRAMPSDHAAIPPSGYLQAGYSALQHYWIADYRSDGHVQWIADRMKRALGDWSFSTADSQWTMLARMDDKLQLIDPVAAKIPLARAAPVSGVVASRSGWNMAADTTDITTLFFCGHIDVHDSPKAGHLQVWRGADELIAGGSNYLGSPSANEANWSTFSYARNCLVFEPKNRTSDLDGGQVMEMDWQRSCEDAPNPGRLLWYQSMKCVGGHYETSSYLIDFRDDGRTAIATADLSLAYPTSLVQSYWRTLIDVRPGVFLLWDRWKATNDVAKVRARFCAKQAVTIGAAQYTLTRGGSKANVLALGDADISVFGGPGKECLVNGTNYLCHGSQHYCQDWLPGHPEHDPRIARLAGQYFVEFATDPAAGELLLAITTGPADGNLPNLEMQNLTSERIVAVNGIKVHLPMTPDHRQPWTE